MLCSNYENVPVYVSVVHWMSPAIPHIQLKPKLEMGLEERKPRQSN